MKFHRTPQFKEDYNSLTESDKTAVDDAFKNIVRALQGDVELRKQHRIKKMSGKNEIWEGHVKLNLCFTFHFENTNEGEKVCFFRRIGTHDIYKNP
jgi:mRNA-degrading endonuclease YafQ of YafQ-DinJ toxin-antitoxin module